MGETLMAAITSAAKPVLPLTVLISAVLLPGCATTTNAPGLGATKPPEEPRFCPLATPEQVAKVDAVVERWPELKPLADEAKANGSVTPMEVIEILMVAERVQAGVATN
jgi:hypothetical protein